MVAVEKSTMGALPSPRLLSVSEAAEQLGISRSSVYNLHKAKAIKFGKLLGRTVIAQSEIDRIIASAERGEAV
jgi:excisionase family DNA binding protein